MILGQKIVIGLFIFFLLTSWFMFRYLIKAGIVRTQNPPIFLLGENYRSKKD